MQPRAARFALFVGLCVFLTIPALTSAQASVPRLLIQPVDENHLTVLNGNTHPMARAQFDRGAAPPNLPMDRMLLVLKRSPEQETALRKLLDDQQDKASPSYHKWLTPDEFGQQFGPSDQDIQVVTGWLQSHGFQIAQVAKGRAVIEFSGTAAQVQEAFHTAIHKFVVNGEDHWANANDPQIPAALTPVVAGVHTLHNFYKQPQYHLSGVHSKSVLTGPLSLVAPLFTFPDQSDCGGNCYAVAPYDFATIYNVLPLWNSGIDGSGETIAIVGRSNINIQDVRDFRSLFGLPAKDPNIILDGPDPGINGAEIEADIDVQWSGAVARNATIDYVVSESTETTDGVDLSAVHIIDQNLAPIMSESFGQCELGLGTAGNQFFSQLWQQASAQGITVFVSSGDDGSAGCDFFQGVVPEPAQFGLAVSGIASTPFNVAVGGTDFNQLSNPSLYWNASNDPVTQASAKGYIPEITWNDSCTNSLWASVGFGGNAETNCNDSRLAPVVFTLGGSGGASNCTTNSQRLGTCSGGYSKPSWQIGQGVPSDGKRDIPDVALFASNGFLGSFYVFCERDASPFNTCNLSEPFLTFFGVGGTSVSSPAFAGIMALVDQHTASRQGNANYVLYKLAAQQSASSCNSSAGPASSCVFNDVTSGTIAMPCNKGSPNCNVANSAHQYGVLSGYATNAAYDLATGLGSVNATNLVNKWNSVNLNPSVTALTTLSPATITHGQAVNVIVTVVPQSGSGTPPTGVVSLVGGPINSKGIADFTLANGTASGTTDLLPGGSYTVTAHYPGDGSYGASDSNAVAVNVNPESSKTFANLVTLDINGNPTSFTSSSATYGSGYFLLRVDVGDSSANVSSATGISSNCSKHITSCPSGTIALNGGSLAGGSLPLNSEGFAEDQSLAPGSYAVSASYPGDSSYGPSTNTANFTIAKAPTTAVAAVAGLPVEYGNSEEIAADVQTTSNGIAPTGTFTFAVDGSPITPSALVYESAPYNPNSSPPSYAWLDASGSTQFLSIGNHTLSVQYSGDANYAAATSAPSAVTVTKAQPFFNSYGAIPSTTNLNQPVTLTAQLFGSQAGAAPSGTITFFDGKTALSGTVTYAAKPATGLTGSSLLATMPYTPTTPGTHDITMSYSGDTFYLPATETSPATLTVLGPFSVTPTTGINISSPGQSGSTTVTLSSNGGFTGTVNLSCTPDPKAKESGCSFGSGSSTSPTVQVNLNGSNATVTFNVTTTAPHPQATQAAASLGISSGIALAGFVLLFIPMVDRRRRVFLTVAAIALTLSLEACGGGSSGTGGGGGGNTDPGTAPGTYIFTIIGSTGNGSSAVSLSTPVTVSVQ